MVGPVLTNNFDNIPARQVGFRFEEDRRLVKDVEQALNELKATVDMAGSGYEGGNTSAGISGGTMVDAEPADVIGDFGARRRIVIPSSGLSADYTVVGDQAGDGVGGSTFTVPTTIPGTGTFLAVHVIVKQNGAVRLGITNVPSSPTPAEDAFPTFQAGDVSSKNLGLLVLKQASTGPDTSKFVRQYVNNVGPDMRRTQLVDPDGAFNTVPIGEQGVTSSGFVKVNGVPLTDQRRKIFANIRATPGAVADRAGLVSRGGTSPVVESIVLSDPPGAASGARLYAELVSDDSDGQDINILLSGTAEAELRLVAFDTYMGR